MRMGKAITAVRERHRWSKADLARRAGVAPSYITRIEQGKFDRPSVDQVKAIADALGVPLAELTNSVPAAVADGIEAELHAMFPPDRAPVIADILRVLARHNEKTQWFILGTMGPLVRGIPGSEQ